MQLKGMKFAAVTLALAATSIQAANWEGIVYSPKESVFVDKQSIHREGDTLKAWVLHSYAAKNYLGDDVFPHQSRLMVYDIHCVKGELGYAQWSFHANELGTGKTVWTGAADEVSFYKPGTASPERMLIDKVCAVATGPAHLGLNGERHD